MHAFTVPDELNAQTPAEQVHDRRDQVRLMAIDQHHSITHSRFQELDEFLSPGDLLVLNNSRTIPPVLQASQGNQSIEIRLSRKRSDDQWEALVACDFFSLDTPLTFNDGVEAVAIGHGSEHPLIVLEFSIGGSALLDFIYSHGEPVRYEYIEEPFPLETYQTVYGSVPGSVEMASAGRAFSWQLLQKLKQQGVKTAFIQLHAGLSYYEKDRWPSPEQHPEAFAVPEETARLIEETRRAGNRVIAVGTTVVRALESAVNPHGEVESAEGTTNLYVDEGYTISAVDGLLTGFHEPEASHLHMLTAFLPKKKLMNAYREALLQGYLWHEFGDMNLILK
ncbi:S-adenosylmethionine:tRNA ribosyltransferase-isomerase [Halobacillus litoralis]|uniref:S-adenosylmethionine:tRNA ribosyltransferase-isomerase n=1 Tax=Halobacillus litoralis TaxID=45668 RepID=UPI001CD459FA|nr:S-adenosylmethionine:tRNA ribosyltransferase-isomerase [Halobacillus litoralis]MCA0972046.1 S-adenosylmethionine:tRNA ribosyltransferase-isomerase [Halobacillus litoralis]